MNPSLYIPFFASVLSELSVVQSIFTTESSESTKEIYGMTVKLFEFARRQDELRSKKSLRSQPLKNLYIKYMPLVAHLADAMNNLQLT